MHSNTSPARVALTRFCCAAIVIAITILIGARSDIRAATSSRPNIIVMISDDAGYNDFGFMSQLNGMPTDVRTPNLDGLAAQSTIMSMGYTSGAVCSPSRAALLTGQYQQRFGHEDNPNALTEGLLPGQKLITHHLKNLGYTTGMIGKWHLGYEEGISRPTDVGFDEFYGLWGGGRPYWGLGATDAGRTLRRGIENIERQWVNEGDTSRYDPVRGRYLTDAFGEESVDFINRHANDDEPFFLYASLPAPHTPFDAKQSDMDEFADIADQGRRAVAAMTYAMDRAVGDIMNALDSNNIAENTIVVFINDNGGPATSVGPYDNGPLRGNKGSVFEGGIRVPYIIKMPGVAPGIYDRPVMSFDLLPTLVNAAGGDASTIDTNGADFAPYLTGEVGGDPHDYLFWRGPSGRFAVRKGDWKLVRPPSSVFSRLHNIAQDPGEVVTLNHLHPELVEEMNRKLTDWEVGLAKARWGALGTPKNRFDHFVHRNDLGSFTNWSTTDGWKQAGTDHNATLSADDAYANAILEFQVRNDADYTSANNMYRLSSQTFMLNQMRFTGQFAGATDRKGTINGNGLLFVRNLDGEGPKIQIDANSTGGQNQFTFRLDNELQLYHDLEITGDGTQHLVINGNIRDFFEPRGIIKSGSSRVTLAGHNTFIGPLTVFGGHVTTTSLAGGLSNQGGIVAPGIGPALTNIAASFEQTAGILELEFAGSARGAGYDALNIAGDVVLGGTLRVSFVDGFAPNVNHTFDIFDWTGGLIGEFSTIELPTLEGGLTWNTSDLYQSGKLRLVGAPVPGDFNSDDGVDAADYVAWRKMNSHDPEDEYNDWNDTFGNVAVVEQPEADLNADGTVNAADYVMFKKHNTTGNMPLDPTDWHGGFGQSDEHGEPGDFNHDGSLDAADFVAWRKALATNAIQIDHESWAGAFGSGPTVTSPAADYNDDGLVDIADFVLWRKTGGTNPGQVEYRAWLDYFGHGSTASSQSGAVPEPATIVFALMTAACGLATLRSRT